MSQRAWFFVNQGQASGPLSDAQIRAILAAGTADRATLVWTDGMADWVKAGEIPELWSHAVDPPPVPAEDVGPVVRSDSNSALAFVAEPWEFVYRGLLFVFGLVLVVPGPWAAASYYRWLVSRVQVPGRPDLVFTGQAGDIWPVFVTLSLLGYVSSIERVWPEYWWVQFALVPANIGLWWLVLRWIASNLASDGTRLPIAFNGSYAGFLGWHVAYYLSILTIIGWAWVANAWTRWMCLRVTGSRRELQYHATGTEFLWRTVVTVCSCFLIIPIPWVLTWYMRWYVSQFTLTERVSNLTSSL